MNGETTWGKSLPFCLRRYFLTRTYATILMWKMGSYTQKIQFSLSSQDQCQMSSWLWFTFGNGFCFSSVDIFFQQLFQLCVQYIVTDLTYSIRYVWRHKRPRFIITDLYCNSPKILWYSLCQHHAWRNLKIIFLSKRKYIYSAWMESWSIMQWTDWMWCILSQ